MAGCNVGAKVTWQKCAIISQTYARFDALYLHYAAGAAGDMCVSCNLVISLLQLDQDHATHDL